MEEDCVGLLGRLVAIDSVNPDLVPGAKGEGEIAAYVAGWLRAQGLEVHLEDSGKTGRPNVVALSRGTGGGRSLMLNAHMDTVGTAGMENPFAAAVHDGRLFGRGAMDTKAALAAFMAALVEANQRPHGGDVILTAVVDEEYASAGTEAVLKKWKADAAIVGEPTGLQVVTAHKGFIWFEIETRGVAAHGSRPDLGVDAIAKMGSVLVAIGEMAEELSASRGHEVLGPGSIHASLIQGGQELSSYPASCRLGIERRTTPGESVDAVEGELRERLDRIEARDRAFAATMRRVFSRSPFEARQGEPIVESVKRHVQAVTKAAPVISGMGAWMDSSLLAAAGIPPVILGPEGKGLHGEVEWVDLDSVRACSAIILAVIEDFCR